MPTTYTDQFWILDPYAPPPVGSALTVQNYDIVDFDDDLDFSAAGGDTLNGIDITGVYNGDTVTVQLGSGSTITVTGVTFYLANGQRMFTPSDGTVLEDATFLSSTWVSPNTQMDVADLGPPCFLPGTLIDTPDGLRKIEEIREGDLVLTRDNGAQPVRWVSRRLARGSGEAAPVRIMAGAMSNTRDLIVSPQHRILVEGWRAELFFGEDELLVSAKHLVNGDTIHRLPSKEVTYLHLLLDRHEVIFAEGIATESFDPAGELALEDPDVRQQVFAHLPSLATRGIELPCTARPVARGHEAGALIV